MVVLVTITESDNEDPALADAENAKDEDEVVVSGPPNVVQRRPNPVIVRRVRHGNPCRQQQLQ
eukprot:scaffold2914_cov178-Amphora_coffeaeformis.AAC.4